MHSLRSLAAVALTAGITASASADFIVPDGTTAPFQDWNQGDSDSLYAQWDVFTVAYAGGGNAPDVGSFPTVGSPLGGDALLTGNVSAAFLTSSGNIYSFSSPTDFTLDVTNYGNGTGWNTRVAVQIRTQGNPLDMDSLELTYDNSGEVTLDPVYYEEVYNEALGGQGGAAIDHLFVFDIDGYNPASFSVDFNASTSSMSLDRLAVDTFTTTGNLTALPVPEPASLALMLIGSGLVSARNRRG